MTDVFISYKRRLLPKVNLIVGELNKLGLEVWYDRSLEPTGSFSDVISREVRTAACVLVCWSNDAFPGGGDKNGWVIGEATIGWNRECLVAATLETADMDPPWNMRQTEDLVGWDPADASADREGWQRVLGVIGRLVNRPGLAAYDRLGTSPKLEDLKAWARSYPSDPLAAGIWDRIKQLELAALELRLEQERSAPPASTTKPAPPPERHEREPEPVRFASQPPGHMPVADVVLAGVAGLVVSATVIGVSVAMGVRYQDLLYPFLAAAFGFGAPIAFVLWRSGHHGKLRISLFALAFPISGLVAFLAANSQAVFNATASISPSSYFGGLGLVGGFVGSFLVLLTACLLGLLSRSTPVLLAALLGCVFIAMATGAGGYFAGAPDSIPLGYCIPWQATFIAVFAWLARSSPIGPARAG